jgi:hypothetical protein
MEAACSGVQNTHERFAIVRGALPDVHEFRKRIARIVPSGAAPSRG